MLIALLAASVAWRAEDPRQIPMAESILVTDERPSEAVSLALEAFVKRAAFLSGEAMVVKPASALTLAERQGKHLIVVGHPHSNALIAETLGEALAADFAGKKDWVTEEGYRLEIRGPVPDRERGMVLAGSWGQRGLVYALSDLEMKLAYVDGRTALVLSPAPPDEPFSRTEGETDGVHPSGGGAAGWISEKVEKPALRGRGIYLNFSDAPDRYILPISWTPLEWEKHIDQWVKARLNFITVYLWYPHLLMAPNPERNRAIHQNILAGLRYAHARGLKFKYLFTPTTVPANVHAECPAEYRAVNPFYNAPLFCPSVPGACEVMKKVYRQQIECFREADAFQIAFFDPGGCFCPTCLQDFGKTLTDHFVMFEELVHSINPAAQVETMLWNADELAHYGYPWADRFLEAMAQHYGDRARNISISCSRKWAEKVKAAGFLAESFLFETNYETSYAFFTPQLPRLYRDTRGLTPLYDSAVCHRLEAGTKYPNTFLCASWLWNPALTVHEITDRYALGFLGAGTQEAFYEVIQTLDALTFEEGNLHLAPQLFAQTQALERLVRSPQVRQQMNWFFVSLYGTAKLAELAATADPQIRAQHIQAFYDLLRSDPTFAPSVAGWIEPMQKAEQWSSFLVTGNRNQGF